MSPFDVGDGPVDWPLLIACLDNNPRSRELFAQAWPILYEAMLVLAERLGEAPMPGDCSAEEGLRTLLAECAALDDLQRWGVVPAVFDLAAPVRWH